MCFRRLERLALSNLLVKEIDLISLLTRHAPTLEILPLENGNLDPAADIGVQPCWVRVIRRLESDLQPQKCPPLDIWVIATHRAGIIWNLESAAYQDA